jgi:hypothetical protein
MSWFVWHGAKLGQESPDLLHEETGASFHILHFVLLFLLQQQQQQLHINNSQSLIWIFLVQIESVARIQRALAINRLLISESCTRIQLKACAYLWLQPTNNINLASITSTQTQLDDSCYCRANNNLLEGKH